MTKDQFESCKIVGTRRQGNSTRIVDFLVQELFTKGKCEYWDHADRLGNVALQHTLNVLKRRLYYEHGLSINKDYKVNLKERTVKMTPPTLQ